MPNRKKGDFFSRAVVALQLLAVLASVQWAGPVLGGIIIVIYGVSLWMIIRHGGPLEAKLARGDLRRQTLWFAYAFTVFLVFANLFVFSAAFFPGQAVAFLIGVGAIAVMLGANLSLIHYERDAHAPIFPVLAVFLVVVMEMVFVLQFLPYGYLTLAVIAVVWYFTILALYDGHLGGTMNARKAGKELLFAATLTIIAAVSSGVYPR